MKALILNSGLGQRMGDFTSDYPKCMTEIDGKETILSCQLTQLKKCGINEVIITTGFFDEVLVNYCNLLNLLQQYTFVKNQFYDRTNYIYSIYLARFFLDDDIILMHGDLVFELGVLKAVLKQDYSCMTVSTTIPLSPKDFKAVIKNKLIKNVGVEFFDNAVAAQPMYKLYKADWKVWLDRIIVYCEKGQVSCYAENAFNEVSNKCLIYPMDFEDRLCGEIDTPEDLIAMRERLNKL